MGFLFVDRILELIPSEVIRGIKHITPDDTYLCHDDQGNLCFMPSLIGETLGQLAAWNVMVANHFTQRPVAGVVSSARMFRSALIGETLHLESIIDDLDDTAVQYHSVARVDDEIIFSIEGALGPLLPMGDFIGHDVVKKQFSDIHLPGIWSNVAGDTIYAENANHTKPLIPMIYDQIIDSNPGVSLFAEKYIHPDSAFFSDHFPNNPVLPMTVLLECKINLARQFLKQANLGSNYHVEELRKIKMNVFVHPGDRLTTQVKLKSHHQDELILNFLTQVNNKRVCVLDMVLKARGDL